MPPTDQVLACFRQSLINPKVPSREGTCDECHFPIWIALSSPPTDRTLCMQCVAVEIEGLDESEVKIGAVTEAQIADLAAYWNRRH